MLNQKSVLARLLANENITVQQGNYETASFDVANRVLRLPMWKEMSSDIIDMLIGHEVAHALYTPTNFNDYNKEGIPRSWYNIVEDVRIEKLVLRKYPGLVSNFKRGYYSLMKEQDLFGIKDVDLATRSFMDRLNVACKARDLIDVEFSDEEMVYVNKALKTETYEDVVALCEEIYAWLKEKAENEEANDADQASMSQSDEEEGDSDMMGAPSDENADGEEEESDNGESGEGQESDKGEESKEGENTDQAGSESAEKGDQANEENDQAEAESKTSNSQGAGADSKQSADELTEAATDVAFNENAASLADDSGFTYAEGVTKAMADAMTVDYKTLAQSRLNVTTEVERALEGMDPNDWYLRRRGINTTKFPEAEFNQFMAETKRVVNLMVKEFEMRKAAYRTQRARTSIKGSLDVNKLHKYKYDDMLFKQATQLADAKNHGLMMLIDYSGSMNYVLPSVIKQLLALTMFCKRVSIPFEVYSFTSASNNIGERVRKVSPAVTHVNASDAMLVELFSSSMSKRDYTEAFRAMFYQTQNRALQDGYESLGSTPLDESLMAMHYKIADFRKKYNVQKMNLVTLTDGASNGLYVNYGEDIDTSEHRSRRWGAYAINVNGKIIKVERNGGYYGGHSNRAGTIALIKSIRDMGVNCINYFVAGRGSDVKNEIFASFEGWTARSVVNEARKDIRKNGVHILDENCGYNRRFIMMGGTDELDGNVAEVEVSSDMSAAKIAKAFGKASDSKKKSRLVTQKFAEIVA